ncbi:hypothetical protein [Paraburkholderia sp.]|uniref:hypothetical protein n=1 Tax=Paraburkholderia sp. TaxID=1926495 RepID=UPI0039E5D0D0
MKSDKTRALAARASRIGDDRPVRFSVLRNDSIGALSTQFSRRQARQGNRRGTEIKALKFSKTVLETQFLIAYHLNEF